MCVGAAALAAGCGGGHHAADSAKPERNAVRIVATRSSVPKGTLQAFHTYKDLRPPRITVNEGPDAGTAPGYIFLTPRAPDQSQPSGPTILDAQGRIVWFHPLPGRVAGNLGVHTYKGKQVLSWGERPPVTSPSQIFSVDPQQAFHVLVDQNYHEITKVRAQGKGVGTDLHELVVTKQNTVLLIGFRVVDRDLTAVGGPADGHVVDGLVQEIDPATGKVLLSWSALDHVPLEDSYWPGGYGDPWDAYHVNGVAVADDGNLLVSIRHTSAVYKIDRKTGKVLWTLGGKQSDFELSDAARFYFQHDPQPLPGNRLMLFDNSATDKMHRRDHSRVIVLKVDEKRKVASLERQIVHDPPVLSVSQGDARKLPNGNVFVGWGNERWFSEYGPSGRQLFDASVPNNGYQSYRAVKSEWVGRPQIVPAVVASTTHGHTLVWVSMNGSTEVRDWRVLGGATQRALEPLGSAEWKGFETRLDVAAAPRVLQVQALGANGDVIATSGLVRPD